MTFQIYSQENAPPESRPALAKAAEDHGYIPDLIGVFAEAPALLNAYMGMDEWMKKTSLNTIEREVVLKTTAHMSNCSWCSSVSEDGEEVPADITRSAEQGRRLDDQRLEALRQYTIGVMQHRGRPSDEAKQAFIHAGYGPQQALEIVLAAGMMTVAAMAASLAHSALSAPVKH
jgi:alkylhydroperoxidase family enzyme